ncbi:MAG: hypothetical protein PVH61_31790 [Candidatus Aminicenantes bacterium]|jgi:threonine/homoserine/homoserine lactone efflux protein
MNKNVGPIFFVIGVIALFSTFYSFVFGNVITTLSLFFFTISFFGGAFLIYVKEQTVADEKTEEASA